MRTWMKAAVAALAMLGALIGAPVQAAEIAVYLNQATESGVRELATAFEKATGHKVNVSFQAGPNLNRRINEGTTGDLTSLGLAQFDEFVKTGKVVEGSVVEYARVGNGVAVKTGAPKPDISTTEALKKTLLAAKSIGYSTGPSGNYVIGMFQRMGIADEIKSKLKQTPTGVFVATLIASGDAEVGFQQVSELIAAPGVDYVGPLPADIQQMTVFSSGILVGAKEVDAAKALVKFITAPAAAAAFKKRGMEPG